MTEVTIYGIKCHLLSIDDKWDIAYDPKNNDKPIAWLRYKELNSSWSENNPVTAMFYALLEIKHYGANV